MDDLRPEPSAELRPRPSRTARAASDAEARRIASLTIEERVKAALSMRRRFAWIAPTEGPDSQAKGGPT